MSKIAYRDVLIHKLPEACPCCSEPFRPFLRHQISRSPRLSDLWEWLVSVWRRQPAPDHGYFAVICWECKEIIGYE